MKISRSILNGHVDDKGNKYFNPAIRVQKEKLLA
jgi:hypothetical protein